MPRRVFCYASRMENLTIIEHASDQDVVTWLEREVSGALANANGDDRIAISVPGGSTPFPIFEKLIKTDLDFSRIDVWPGDDRIVPEDHEASNTGKIRALLEPAGANVCALTQDAQPPRFALVWLGMGADGHIASLFPNTDPQLDASSPVIRLTPDPLPPEAPFDRLTMTMPALLNSDQLAFVIRGEDKRAVFDAAVNGRHDLPIARLLSGASQEITCFS